MPAKVLTSKTVRGTLRWAYRPNLSYRTYDFERSGSAFCVPSRASELAIVLAGEAWLEMGARRQALRIRPGEAGMVFKNTPHLSHFASGTRLVIFDLPSLGEEPLGLSFLDAKKLPGWMCELAVLAAESRDEEVAARCLSRACELSALRRASHRELTLEHAHGTATCIRIKALLDSHYREPIRLGDIAARARRDKDYVIRGFHQNFGVTPMAYVQFLRTEHFVWSLLKAPDDSLLDLALSAGVGDYSTFSRRIRSRFGAPPSRLVCCD